MSRTAYSGPGSGDDEQPVMKVWESATKEQPLTQWSSDKGWRLSITTSEDQPDAEEGDGGEGESTAVAEQPTSVWLEGQRFGTDQLYFRWYPEDADSSQSDSVPVALVSVIVPGVDIDTDSNNNNQLMDANEDQIEAESAKRIFINHDDDDRDGIPDIDATEINRVHVPGENDLAKVNLFLGLPFGTDYRGLEARLTIDPGLRLWSSSDKLHFRRFTHASSAVRNGSDLLSRRF